MLNILPDRNLENTVPQLPEKRITDERICHMHGVAELMYQYHDAFQCHTLTSEQCYFLGLNHDIGYIDRNEDHEIHGGKLASYIMHFHKGLLLAHCIEYHGHTPSEYKKIWRRTDAEIPNELILLWWANMCVESDGEHAGEVVGLQGRLDRMRKHYGEDSQQYKRCQETIHWLVNWIQKEGLCG